VDDSERPPTYLFEGFRLDTQRRTLLGLDGRAVALAPKTLDTLCHLVARAEVGSLPTGPGRHSSTL
jgi:hypothetical protein